MGMHQTIFCTDRERDKRGYNREREHRYSKMLAFWKSG